MSAQRFAWAVIVLFSIGLVSMIGVAMWTNFGLVSFIFLAGIILLLWASRQI